MNKSKSSCSVKTSNFVNDVKLRHDFYKHKIDPRQFICTSIHFFYKTRSQLNIFLIWIMLSKKNVYIMSFRDIHFVFFHDELNFWKSKKVFFYFLIHSKFWKCPFVKSSLKNQKISFMKKKIFYVYCFRYLAWKWRCWNTTSNETDELTSKRKLSLLWFHRPSHVVLRPSHGCVLCVCVRICVCMCVCGWVWGSGCVGLSVPTLYQTYPASWFFVFICDSCKSVILYFYKKLFPKWGGDNFVM